MIDNTFCTNVDVLNVIMMIKSLISIIKIAVPILLILFSMIELLKAVASEELLAKVKNKIGSKMLAAVIVFLVPSIVEMTISIVDEGKSYQDSSCFTNANKETIADFKAMKEITFKTEQEKQNQDQIIIDDLNNNSQIEGTIVSKMMTILQNQVGNKGTIYKKDFKTGQGTPWCVVFVWWVSKEAGVYPTLMSLKTDYTETMLDYFKSGKDANVVWHDSKAKGGKYTPKAGDYIMFNYKQGQNRRVSHIGIVKRATDTQITYIHGNSGGGTPVSSKVSETLVTSNKSSIVGYGSWY